MIVLNLSCHNGHQFEGWFASRAAFDGQSERALVQCAQCMSTQVQALPSGPRVLRHHDAAVVPAAAATRTATTAVSMPSPAAVQAPAPEAVQQVYAALASLARRAENVGERFPEEARRIHYDEAPARAIRGRASPEEALELLEEGILVLPAPSPAEGELH